MSGQIIDELLIGQKKVLVKLCELEQSILKFYPENPRVYSALNADGSVPSQTEIEEHMKEMEHVKELSLDIQNNGGLMEAIIVRDGDYVVLEGNSRLAAYRILAEKDPIKWGKIKCKVLPHSIGEDLIFKLLGQFHIKGRKDWEPYEQANYLYRRIQTSKLKIEFIAKDLGISKKTANDYIVTIDLMKSKKDNQTRNFSYYYEYVKNKSIKKYRETSSEIDDIVAKQIKLHKFNEARDIRKLADVAKQNDKQGKKLMQKYIAGEISVYDAYDAVSESGKLDDAVGRLKKFKEYIDDDSFEKKVKTSKEVFDKANFEIDRIMKRLNQLKKKWK